MPCSRKYKPAPCRLDAVNLSMKSDNVFTEPRLPQSNFDLKEFPGGANYCAPEQLRPEI